MENNVTKSKKQSRRHPAEVTASRLGAALDKWPDAFSGADRDAIGNLIYVLDGIAEGDTDHGR